jgi:hypothetical protein
MNIMGVSDNVTTGLQLVTDKSGHESPTHERKYNLIIYGIPECTQGTPRHERLVKDCEEVTSVLSSVNTNITTNSIRDCYRLGKYLSDRTRPLMAKLSRTSDVNSIFSQRSKLAQFPGIYIKPDMTHQERTCHRILLKERWNLINSGVDKKTIKIKGSSLFVNNCKHGHISDSKFVLCPGPLNTQTTDSNVLNNNISTDSPITVNNVTVVNPA